MRKKPILHILNALHTLSRLGQDMRVMYTTSTPHVPCLVNFLTRLPTNIFRNKIWKEKFGIQFALFCLGFHEYEDGACDDPSLIIIYFLPGCVK